MVISIMCLTRTSFLRFVISTCYRPVLRLHDVGRPRRTMFCVEQTCDDHSGARYQELNGCPGAACSHSYLLKSMQHLRLHVESQLNNIHLPSPPQGETEQIMPTPRGRQPAHLQSGGRGLIYGFRWIGWIPCSSIRWPREGGEGQMSERVWWMCK